MTRAAVLLRARAGVRYRRRAQEGVFLTEEQAPKAVFPDADRFVAARRRVDAGAARAHDRRPRRQPAVAVGGALRRVRRRARRRPSLGRALVVEEIGKHRPITFVVGVRPDGSVNDVAVMAYREAYGGEVRSSRFLRQYRGKAPGDPLRGGRRHHEHRGRHAVGGRRRAAPCARHRPSRPPSIEAAARTWARRPERRGDAAGRWPWLLVLLPCLATRGPRTRRCTTSWARTSASPRTASGAAAGMPACFREARRLDARLLALERDERAVAPERDGARATGPVSADMAGSLSALARAVRRHRRRVRRRRRPADGALAPARAARRRTSSPRRGPPPRPRRGTRSRGDRVTLAPGARLDFDGVAKGLRGRRVRRAPARRRRVGAALVSLGESSLYAHRLRPQATRTGGSRCAAPIRRPRRHGSGCATPARRCRPPSGATARRRGSVAHIVDPRSGRAARGRRRRRGRGALGHRRRGVDQGAPRVGPRRGRRARARRRDGGDPRHAPTRSAPTSRDAGSSRGSRCRRRARWPPARSRCDEGRSARPGYLLSDARLEVRLVYTGFLVLALDRHGDDGGASSGCTSGPRPEAIAAYFRGGERDGAMTFPKTLRELVELTHFHAFIMGVVYLVLAHLVLATSAPDAGQAGRHRARVRRARGRSRRRLADPLRVRRVRLGAGAVLDRRVGRLLGVRLLPDAGDVVP